MDIELIINKIAILIKEGKLQRTAFAFYNEFGHRIIADNFRMVGGHVMFGYHNMATDHHDELSILSGKTNDFIRRLWDNIGMPFDQNLF